MKHILKPTIKYIIIISFIFSISKTSSQYCYLSEYEFSNPKFYCDVDQVDISLFPNDRITVDLTFENGIYVYYLNNFTQKERFCDQVFQPNFKVNFFCEIASFPSDIPTIGIRTFFKYNFPCTTTSFQKPIFIKSILGTKVDTVGSFTPVYNPMGTDSHYVDMPPGCGPIQIYSSDYPQRWLYNSSYKSPVIQSQTLSDGKFVITGSNLGNATIDIIALDDLSKVKNTAPNAIYSADHSSVSFDFPESQYQGIWEINVILCGTKNNAKKFDYSPKLYNRKSAVSDDGGWIKFQGQYLKLKSSEELPIGNFNNKQINCIGISASEIKCNIPERNGTYGYNLLFYVTINGYKTSPIKFNYDLPLIIAVKHEDTNKFQLSGVYFDNVIAVQVLVNGKTVDIGSQVSDPLHFIINSNSSITAFIPTNSQTGYMKLIINSNTPFTTPSFNFKATPSITVGQELNSNTRGQLITINGTFLRRLDYSDVPVPIQISGTNHLGYKSYCRTLVDGDGNSIKCYISPGIGSNYTMYVTYYNTIVGSFNFSYISPSISGFFQVSDGSLKIVGENLGDVPELTQVIIQRTKADTNPIIINAVSSDHSNIKFKFPAGQQINTGFLRVRVVTLSNETIEFKIKPIIGSVSSIPTSGGNVTISGHFFNTAGNISGIYFDKLSCTNILVKNDIITCYIKPSLISTSPQYTSGTNKWITIDGFLNPDIITFSFEPPTISNISSIKSNGDVIISGNSFGDVGLQVFINDQKCISPLIIDPDFTLILCSTFVNESFVDTILNITVYVTDQVGYNNGKLLYKFEKIVVNSPKESGFPNVVIIGMTFVIAFIGYAYVYIHRVIVQYRREKLKIKRFLDTSTKVGDEFKGKHKNVQDLGSPYPAEEIKNRKIVKFIKKYRFLRFLFRFSLEGEVS